MANFQKITRKDMSWDTAITGAGIASVGKAGTGGTVSAFVNSSASVGATGDNAAKSGTGGTTDALSRVSCMVGATGDNAAKSGKGI